MSHNSDLLSWQISNPSNLQDHLPQPYRLIDQVLRQTILYQLQLNMHYIQQKKKDHNYQGKVQQYAAQSLIELETDISCVSSQPKYQNYLLAGDRKGNLLVVDVAKKSLFSKKQITPGKRINYITETNLYDSETYITVSAVISNNSNNIKILRSKHNEPKIFIVCDVQVTDQQNNPEKFPYECRLQDDARLLIVKTYEGSIVAFALPELRLDDNKIKQQFNLNQTLSNSSNSVKKHTIYPLESAQMDKNHGKISQKLFQLKFDGYQKPLKYKDMLNRLKNKSKQVQNTEAQQANKKDLKKDAKKPQISLTQAPKQPQKQILHNQKQPKSQTILLNNNDITQPYRNPKFAPFFQILYEQVECPRKKSFEKGRNIKMAKKIIYGWTNTKEVYSCNLLAEKSPKYENTPLYQQFLQSQILLTQDQVAKLETGYKKSFSQSISQKTTHTCNKTIYPITCTSISIPDRTHVAFGLQDGTVAIYSSDSMTLEYTTEKHSSKVSVVQFFQNGWKIISGSENGQVYISNIVEMKPQMKKTHLFQPKEKTPIVDIKVNGDVGIAFVIDVKGNVRVYDLWRNDKISRLVPCNAFSMAEGKGKRWVPAGHLCSTPTIYMNRDYSVFLSIDWPNIPTSKAQQVSKQLIQKVNQLERNPWRSPEINLHVVRNFEFLLDHFDGLQTIYKKGYEKAKILNLFTNLEFTQLYDRNFDVPDFGRAVNINEVNKNATLKSQISGASKFTSSDNGVSRLKQSKSKSKSKDKLGSGSSFISKETSNGHTRQVKLTTQVLHPQKFLFERRKVELSSLPTSNQKLIETIRQEHKKKQRRAIKLQEELNRTAGGI